MSQSSFVDRTLPIVDVLNQIPAFCSLAGVVIHALVLDEKGVIGQLLLGDTIDLLVEVLMSFFDMWRQSSNALPDVLDFVIPASLSNVLAVGHFSRLFVHVFLDNDLAAVQRQFS